MKKGVSTPIVVTHIISGDLWAGAEVQVYNLFKAFSNSKNFILSAVVFNTGILSRKLIEIGFSVTIADERALGALGISRIIAEHCRAHKTDIVHTHGFKENILGILAKEMTSTPFSIRTVHGNPEFAFNFHNPLKWLMHQIDLSLSRWRQHAIIAVSSQLETKLNIIFPGKVHKILNFIDVADLQGQWPLKRRAFNSTPRIGIVGRLVQVKRVDIFIQTISLLNNQGIPCIGVIIGDGPLSEHLKKLAEELSIQDKLEFKGFVNPAIKEVINLDVLMMTSDHEGLPMTLLEALALKVPVIAHNVGGVFEAINGGDCGWLVEDHIPQGYAKAVRQLLDQKKERKHKTRLGAEHVKTYFDVASSVDEYKYIYQSCAHKTKKSKNQPQT